MDEANTPATKAADDSGRELGQLLAAGLQIIGGHAAEAARAQAQAAQAQASSAVQLATIQADTERLHMKHGFRLRLIGALMASGTIGAAFYTGRYELVTHALAGVVGLMAGYGLGRSAR